MKRGKVEIKLKNIRQFQVSSMRNSQVSQKKSFLRMRWWLIIFHRPMIEMKKRKKERVKLSKAEVLIEFFHNFIYFIFVVFLFVFFFKVKLEKLTACCFIEEFFFGPNKSQIFVSRKHKTKEDKMKKRKLKILEAMTMSK